MSLLLTTPAFYSEYENVSQNISFALRVANHEYNTMLHWTLRQQPMHPRLTHFTSTMLRSSIIVYSIVRKINWTAIQSFAEGERLELPQVLPWPQFSRLLQYHSANLPFIVGIDGLEPPTFRVSAENSDHWVISPFFGCLSGTWTHDPFLIREVR